MDRLEIPPLPGHPDPHSRGLPLFHQIQQSSPCSVSRIQGVCNGCKKSMRRRDLKECQKCRRVNYCGVPCQRADWPEHKRTCNVSPDLNLTFCTGRRLAEHDYFRMHMLLYALSAMGPPKFADEPHDFVLMVVVDMVPVSAAKPEGRKRITVTNMLPVPTSVLPADVYAMLDLSLQNVAQHTVPYAVHALLIVTAEKFPEGEDRLDSRFRISMLFPSDFITSHMDLPEFSLDLFSHSHGVYRRVNLDMDFLFESINDELQLDEDDYYQMQA
ncbi:MYND finger [Mycena sanguinolenta]|uniref:MYND finger n=1 Tax=Mycena sanguinolenta TaxID=230812 RepID=A0A8H7DJZ7_9AGAR|nr:MYND finger [Mycena sanguinolenta]